MGKAPSPERVSSVFRAAEVADEAVVLTLSQLDACNVHVVVYTCTEHV